MDEISTPSSEISRLRIHHSCLWQQHSPYEPCSASYMALAPVCAHRDTFWPGYIMFTEKLSITLKISELFLPPGSCLQNRNSSCISFWSTNHKKAERRLTHRWIHLIEVQNNMLSGVLQLEVPSHQLPIHQA